MQQVRCPLSPPLPRRPIAALAALVLCCGIGGKAFAVCGDVTGDDQVRASDALAVLKQAVGQDAGLQCTPEPIVPVNSMGFANTLFCNGRVVTAEMTWSEHPQFRWESASQEGFPVEAEFFRVDDLFVGGEVEVDYGTCGTIVFDIDSWGVLYPMPAEGSAVILPLFDETDSTVNFFLDISPTNVEGTAASAGAAPPATQRFALARIPAPPGLGVPPGESAAES
jgi:hypothetical protein